MLVTEKKQPSRHEVSFDGSALASGVYIYRFTAGAFTKSVKMLLLKQEVLPKAGGISKTPST